MGSGEQIVPEQVIGYANALDHAASPSLDAAKAAFAAAEIDGGAFSPVGIALAIAYPGSQHWAVNDAQSKHDELRAITDNMAATAKHWATAETDNTIVEC